jgi:hypothetical protein
MFSKSLDIGQNGSRRIKQTKNKGGKHKLCNNNNYYYSLTNKIYPSPCCVQEAKSMNRDVDLFGKSVII